MPQILPMFLADNLNSEDFMPHSIVNFLCYHYVTLGLLNVLQTSLTSNDDDPQDTVPGGMRKISMCQLPIEPQFVVTISL